jgi:hypothetical protein
MQTNNDISQALSIGKLCKSHREVLIEALETFYLVVALVSLDAAVESMYGKIIRYLNESIRKIYS